MKLKKIITKHNIIICFIIAIAIATGYFLWQIDRHEKALLGSEWLNPVPHDVWSNYLQKDAEYKKTLNYYIEQNKNLIDIIASYQNNDSKPSLLANMIGGDANTYFTNNQRSILSQGSLEIMKSRNPEEFKIWQSILIDLQARKINAPKPSNPPKPVIQQNINSLYRLMGAIDGILLLSLISFLVLYKGNNQNNFTNM